MTHLQKRILHALSVPALRINKMSNGVSLALVRVPILCAALGGSWSQERREAIDGLVVAGLVARYQRFHGERPEYIYAITGKGLREVLEVFEAV